MRASTALALACALVIAIALVPARAQEGDAKRAIYEAFSLVVEAHEAGGDVSELVEKLNKAIELLEGGDERGALELAEEAAREAPLVAEEGARRTREAMLLYALAAVAIAAAAASLYLLVSRNWWRAWLRARRKYRLVVRERPAERKSMLLDEEVRAVALAVVVVAAVFAISQALLAGRVVEPFSELGLLGREMKIGDYPRELLVGERALLYVYVGNHMGRPMYYVVQVKVGDRETPIDPAPLEPVATFERVLLHNSTWIFPLEISFDEPGLNKRLIVELWIYNETAGEVQYHGKWCQLWINVTRP